MVRGAYTLLSFALTGLTFKMTQKGKKGLVYSHGGIYFHNLCANRVKFQVDPAGPIWADVWPWGHILS